MEKRTAQQPSPLRPQHSFPIQLRPTTLGGGKAATHVQDGPLPPLSQPIPAGRGEERKHLGSIKKRETAQGGKERRHVSTSLPFRQAEPSLFSLSRILRQSLFPLPPPSTYAPCSARLPQLGTERLSPGEEEVKAALLSTPTRSLNLRRRRHFAHKSTRGSNAFLT